MKLRKHINGSGNITSYTINISKKEAQELNWLDENGEGKELQKTIIDGKLVIEELKESE